MGLRHVAKPHWKARLEAVTQIIQPAGREQNTTDDMWHSDINWVIMDYLVSEGYPGAAEKFAQETNMDPAADMESIRERVAIRNAIHAGKIDEAIEAVNEVDPEVSESLPHPSF